MKIYWKNLIWNYTVRYWLKLICFRDSIPWKNYICSKRIWNSKQRAELEKKLKNESEKISFLTAHFNSLNNDYIAAYLGFKNEVSWDEIQAKSYE